jgi:MoaA/NifB/PqqE/SkfB family radical SAM enzyme
VGSQRAARDALVNLSAAGIPVSVNTQINRWTWRDLPELLELLVEHRAHAWQLALTVPMGRAADHPELLLEAYELLEVFPAIAAVYACRGAGSADASVSLDAAARELDADTVALDAGDEDAAP